MSVSRHLAQFSNIVDTPDGARGVQGARFRIRRADSVEAEQVRPSPQHECGEALQGADRRQLEIIGTDWEGR